ncbi:MAG: hypothetical protein A2511_12525 [Deltaproteobacteria bacterium RIFOXYD12_FULL_50_9]|nr:MAG: hypothetical protein A2511_12525 [Deltaproteobacteria bacterium RIFOXYD12_FULL_50_9]
MLAIGISGCRDFLFDRGAVCRYSHKWVGLGGKDDFSEPGMAHQFSVEIHNFLTGNLEEARQILARATQERDEAAVRFQEGRIAELLFFRQQLVEKYDLKDQRYFKE